MVLGCELDLAGGFESTFGLLSFARIQLAIFVARIRPAD